MYKSNPNSHLTAIQRNKLSYPARKLKEANLLKGRILDFGSGFGQDVDFLKTAGFEIQGYDPHYQPKFPKTKFDTILCFYVLNVVFKEEQSRVIWQISQLLKKGGSAYFAVRRDLRREGFRFHHIHQVETYQTLVKLPFKSWMKAKHCEIYHYQRFSDLHPKRFEAVLGEDYEFVGETACCLVLKKGVETYLFPKRQLRCFEQLNSHEQAAMHWLRKKMNAKIMEESFKNKDYAWRLAKTT
jgi:SAM-dependent methyltransferase